MVHGMAHHLRTEPVLNALNMALARRRPEQVIHHSDQGAQYTSLACSRNVAPPSIGRCPSGQSETFEQPGRASLFFLDRDHARFEAPDIDAQPAEQGDLKRGEGESGTDDGPDFDAHVVPHGVTDRARECAFS